MICSEFTRVNPCQKLHTLKSDLLKFRFKAANFRHYFFPTGKLLLCNFAFGAILILSENRRYARRQTHDTGA